ncbi:MAG: hypothetical protein ACJ74Z_04870, partial [Bryobacteraceae bacterium]
CVSVVGVIERPLSLTLRDLTGRCRASWGVVLPAEGPLDVAEKMLAPRLGFELALTASEKGGREIFNSHYVNDLRIKAQ